MLSIEAPGLVYFRWFILLNHVDLLIMTLPVSGSVPKKVQDFVEGLHDVHSSDDDNVVSSRANFVYPGENDPGPSIEERAILFLETQDRVKKGPLFK
ncbi:hypothetical protein Tco_0346595, partial [Tanacetum coccineum]